MSNEQKLELIKSYIDDIKSYKEDKSLSFDKKQHLERAFFVYNGLYKDAEKGKVDLDFLHENITSFLYVVQS
jgi:hypothetical protein